MEIIKEDLKSLNIEMDNFFSEQAMIDSNAIDKSISALKDKGLIYTGIIDAPKGKVHRLESARATVV